ncbi:MAG: EVE domain-containing protein [Archaeoglobaceae archaeon]
MKINKFNNWIWPVSKENWEIVKEREIWATFNKKACEMIKKGDKIIMYVRGTNEFRGIFEVVSDWYETDEIIWDEEIKEGKVKYPYQVRLKTVVLGKATFKDLKDELEFTRNREAPGVYLVLRGLQGLPANNGKPISDLDFNLIFNQMIKHSAKDKMLEKDKKRLDKDELHKNLVRMLKEIGEAMNFIVKTEESTPDGVYRYDVTWRYYEGHAPIKVFEVELSGNIDKGLARLAHAYDIWRPEYLYIIIPDEDSNRVKRLVEKGAFSILQGRLKILTCAAVKELYESVAPHLELVKDLSK